jgi:hypothetical protein
MRKFDTYRYDKSTSQRRIAATPKNISEISTPRSAAKQQAVNIHSPKMSTKSVSNVTYRQVEKYSQPKLSSKIPKATSPLSNENKIVHTPKVHSKIPASTHNMRHVAENKGTPSINSTSVLALHVVKRSKAMTSSVLANQFAPPKSTKRTKRLSQKKLNKIFYAAGLSVFLLATVASVQTIITNHQAKQQLGVLGEKTQVADGNGVLEGTGSEPSESPVGSQAIASYTVSPDMPRYIRIPSLGVYSRIKHTGVTKDGAVDAPANINDASWYKASAKPGSGSGSSLLLGHVSGWTAPGVFKKINQLKAGMRFEIELGSGEKLNYEVVRGESIPLDQVDMAKILESEVLGEHDMKLMTCAGRYNRETDHYEERYVVYAKILR